LLPWCNGLSDGTSFHCLVQDLGAGRYQPSLEEVSKLTSDQRDTHGLHAASWVRAQITLGPQPSLLLGLLSGSPEDSQQDPSLSQSQPVLFTTGKP
jgi:hypothetical protein